MIKFDLMLSVMHIPALTSSRRMLFYSQRVWITLENVLSISCTPGNFTCCAHIYPSSETVVQDLRGMCISH